MEKIQNEKIERLKSLDALRGFDMLFIMGLTPFIVALCNFFPESGFMMSLSAQMRHAEWHGITHHDTIFPLFLFVAGISFPFSLAKQRTRANTNREIHYKIIKRGIILVLLGFVYNGIFRLDFETMRYTSVLGRIGLAWMFAALLFVNFSVRVNVIISIAILIGYWLLLWLIPDVAKGDPFSFENNLVGTVDRALLPGRLLSKTFDPEGFLSTIPAIATALLGMFTGAIVKTPNQKLSENKKIIYMILLAILLAIVGYVWSYVFPINKKLWTSSFVCVVAAYSLFLFALFYYVIDIRGFHRWSFFLKIVGLNSITIYLAQRVINFNHTSNFFLGGVISLCPEEIGLLIKTSGYLMVCWLFLYFLYRQKIFLKV